MNHTQQHLENVTSFWRLGTVECDKFRCAYWCSDTQSLNHQQKSLLSSRLGPTFTPVGINNKQETPLNVVRLFFSGCMNYQVNAGPSYHYHTSQPR